VTQAIADLLLVDAVRLDEVGVDSKTGVLTVTVIEAGLNSSQTVMYPPSVLQRDGKIFEGAKMFLNHQSFMEEMERPEGDLATWVANLKEVRWDDAAGALKGKATIIDPVFLEKVKRLDEVGELPTLGVSIRAFGKGERKEVEGIKHKVLVIEELSLSRSVDFVTYPGAGGKAELLESDWAGFVSAEWLQEKRPDLVEEIRASQGGGGGEMQDLTAEQLRESRPDLVQELQEDKTSAEVTEIKAKLIAGLREDLRSSQGREQSAAERAVVAERERDEAKERVRELERQQRKDAARKLLDEALSSVDDLPEVVIKRIRDRFSEAESIDGIVEAIRIERDYLKELSGQGFVRDLGGSGDEDRPAPKTQELEEVFKGLGFEGDTAKIAAGGRF